MNVPVDPVPPLPTEHEFENSLAEATPAMLALAREQLASVNLDVAVVFTTLTGALPSVLAHRNELAQLTFFRVAAVDNLRVHTYAMFFAHAKYTRSKAPTAALAPLAKKCGDRFDVLAHGAQSLIDCNYLPPDALANYNQEQTARATATDTVALAAMLRDKWPSFDGHTSLTHATLDDAEKAASDVLALLAERDRLEREGTDAAEQRQRAFSLVVRDYEEVRRGMLFLRWYEGDADKLAPSLYAGRTGPHSKDDPATPATPAAK